VTSFSILDRVHAHAGLLMLSQQVCGQEYRLGRVMLMRTAVSQAVDSLMIDGLPRFCCCGRAHSRCDSDASAGGLSDGSGVGSGRCGLQLGHAYARLAISVMIDRNC